MRIPRSLAVDSLPMLLLAAFLFPFPSGAATGGVVGVVVDGKGRPVADAKIEMTRTPGGFPTVCGCSQDQEIYRARTGPDGRFAVRGLTVSWFELRIDHPAFAPLTRKGVVVPDAAGAVDLGRLTLDTGRKLDGIVVDGEGRPLANTALWIGVRNPGRATRFSSEARDRSREPTGSSRFPSRRWGASKSMPAGATAPGSCGRSTGSAAFSDRPALLWTRSRPDSADAEGHPVPGARVSAGMYVGPPSDVIDSYNPCPQTDSSPSSVADAEGRFVLEPIAQGVFGVWASADGFVPNEQQGVELGGASGPRSLDIVLRRGASLAGQVHTGAGAPVPDARISVSCQGGALNTSTGSDGRYRLSSLPPGGTCTLSVLSSRFNDLKTAVEIKAAENHLDLQLVPIETVEIRGRVIGPESEPVAGAEVEIRGAIDYREHLTAADGSFAVETAAGSSDCGLSVWKDGYAAYRSQNVECGEAAGERGGDPARAGAHLVRAYPPSRSGAAHERPDLRDQ